MDEEIEEEDWIGHFKSLLEGEEERRTQTEGSNNGRKKK